MAIIDERGRVFGRINLIDAGVVLAVVVLMPLAYAAYTLLRPLPVRISRLEPAQVIQGRTARVTLSGENLRPYLRAQVGGQQPNRFLIESPTQGEMVLPDLAPGTYDVMLYDEAELVAKRPGALVVVPPPPLPPAILQLAGVATGLSEAAARGFAAGRRLPDAADSPLTIIDARPPSQDAKRVHISADSAAAILVPTPGSWQVPATLRGNCTFVPESQRCKINGVVVVAGAALPLPDGAQFLVDEIRPDAPGATLDVVVRFVGFPESIEQIKIGDVDVSAADPMRAARISSLRDRRTVNAQVSTRISHPRLPLEVTTQVSDRAEELEAVVRLTAQVTPGGYTYRFDPIKTGALFTFDASHYIVRGTIVRLTLVPGTSR